MKPVEFWSMDLEMEQPSGEIISIGVHFPNNATLNYMITPSQPLSEFIKGLTGYEDNMFHWKSTREECFRAFVEEMNEYSKRLGGVHKEAITWGQGDVPLLLSELRKHNLNYSEFLGRRCIDVKTLYMMDRLYRKLSINNKCSLSSAYKTLLRDKENLYRAHNSGDDAAMTYEVFNALRKLNEMRNEVLNQAASLGRVV